MHLGVRDTFLFSQGQFLQVKSILVLNAAQASEDTFMIFFRAHLEASAEKWNRLLTSLEELIKWLNAKDEELKKQMPIGGDVPTLQQQYDHCKVSCLCDADKYSKIR